MNGRVSQKKLVPRALALVALIGATVFGAALPSTRSSAAEPAVPAGQRKVSLDFVGAEVHVVAKALSVQSGVNVVVMPSVNGKVTIRLSRTPLEDALRRVAAAVGSDVRRLEDTYFLGSSAELKGMIARSGVRETYQVQHVQATQVKELLVAALPYLTVEVAGGKMLVLTGTREDVDEAVGMAKNVDVAAPVAPVPPPAAPPVTRDTYAIKHAVPALLVDTLTKALPEMKVSHVEKTLVLEGTAVQHSLATKIIGALDVAGNGEKLVVDTYTLKYLHPIQTCEKLKTLFPALQVSEGFDSYSPGRARFVPIGSDAQKALDPAGLGNGNSQNSSSSSSVSGQADLSGSGYRSRNLILMGPREDVERAVRLLTSQDTAPVQVLIEARVVDMSPESSKQLGLLYDWSPLSFTEFTRGATGGGRSFAGSFARTPFDFQVTLEAMEQRREAKILARPNISVLDGEEASIFIGDIVRYERLTSVSDSGQQVFTVETVPVGVALLCRPRVTNGDITLRVHPMVSTIKAFTGRNRDIPVTSSREAESIVRMKDGDTLAIGGLLKEEELKTLTKIPILGDLPLLGQLFRHKDTRKTKSEVTIFLTARLQKP